MGMDRSSTIMGFVAFYGYEEAIQAQQKLQSIKDNCKLLTGGCYGMASGAAAAGSRVEERQSEHFNMLKKSALVKF